MQEKVQTNIKLIKPKSNFVVTASNSILQRTSVADSAGMLASVACAIHCAAMPLVIGYLPVLGLEWLSNESFHQVMAFVCFALALPAFIPGWRNHGSFVPAGVGLTGIALLSFAAFVLEGSCCPTCTASSEANTLDSACTDETCEHCVHTEPPQVSPQESAGGFADWIIPLVTPLGGCLLVAGHLVNHRKSCACRDGQCCLESVSADKSGM